MLLRPSDSIYQLGLGVLRTLRFNYTHGFNVTGRPLDVLPISLLDEHIAPRDAWRIRDGSMIHRNAWDVVCGDADQGLFIHVFLVLLRGKTFAFPLREPSFTLHHFYGPNKPWAKKVRCLKYFDFLKDEAFVQRRAGAPSTRCMRKLQEKVRCLTAGSIVDRARRWGVCKQCRRDGQKTLDCDSELRPRPAGYTTTNSSVARRCKSGSSWWAI